MAISNRVAFPLVLQSPVTGSAIVGAKATITKHVIGGALGSGEAAEIFTTETEATKVSGDTIVSDNTGRWTQGEGAAYAQYWVPQGTYDIQITGTGLTAVTITRELVSGNAAVQVPSGGTPTALSWGHIEGFGPLISASSGDFTITRPGTGIYKIQWNTERLHLNYCVVACAIVNPLVAYPNSENAKEATVFTWNLETKAFVNAEWRFVALFASV